jgi:NADPH-dependent curcumin reductase CurA
MHRETIPNTPNMPHLLHLPKTSREVRLAARPAGLPALEHFDVVETPVPVPGPGEVLIRNRCFPVPASLRMMISEGAEDVPGVPFPALRPGDTVPGGAIGEIVSAPDGSGLRPGDLVSGMFGWREYAVIAAAECALLGDELPDPVAHLSHGWTAYAALTRGVRIEPGDTVFITSAAGAIGSMAGQIARRLGAGRVIGSTSSQRKAGLLTTELGYDAAVIRGTEPIDAQLAKAAPEGIDVCLDNVGGDQLRAAVTAALAAL